MTSAKQRYCLKHGLVIDALKVQEGIRHISPREREDILRSMVEMAQKGSSRTRTT